MKAKVIIVEDLKGVICKACLRKRKGGLIEKGEKALRIKTESAVSSHGTIDYYCVSHGRHIIRMFAELDKMLMTGKDKKV